MNDVSGPVSLRSLCLPTLKWLKQSTKATPEEKGSAAFYSLFSGWAGPYPETTGYLIPTLYDYGKALNDPQWTSIANDYSRWLCSLQLSNGAFPRSIDNEEPIVFDTGMILFGLKAAWEHTGEDRFAEALQRAASWIADCMEPEGYWKQYCFTPGFAPAYHSRIVWALLEANKVLRSDELHSLAGKAHVFHLKFFSGNHGIREAGFSPGEAATTHTLAYTLRGLLESAWILDDRDTIERTALAGNKLTELLKIKGRLAGAYDENWNGDYSFICITGHAQLSLFLGRLYEGTQNPAFLDGSRNLFEVIADAPSKFPLQGIRGGIAGSRPFWGPYQRFRWLNWAAKFYLDAALMYHTTVHGGFYCHKDSKTQRTH